MLLLTLVLLTIVAVGSAHVARQSLLQATLALHAEEELQRRWLTRSCEEVLLERAELALDSAAASQGVTDRGLVSVSRELEIGPYRIELYFSDEQAKVNANGLLARLGRRPAEAQLATLLRQEDIHHRVSLRPLSELDRSLYGARADWPALASFDQVLSPPPAVDDRIGAHEIGLVPSVTLWGDGRVNVRRASRAVLELTLAPELGGQEVHRLLALRREEPDEHLGQWLSRLQLSRRQRERLEERLTHASGCYGLHIRIRGEQRSWERLVIAQRSAVDDEDDASRGEWRGWRVLHRRVW